MSQDVWVVVETLRGEVTEITYTLLAAGRVLADGLGGKLTALLLGRDAEQLAGTLGAADTVVYVDHAALAEFTPDAYRRAIAATAKGAAPRAILLGHTSMGTDVASGLSLDLDAPVVSSCQTVRVEAGQPWYGCLTCGGKIVAEGEMPGPTCVVTMAPGGYKPEAGRLDRAAEMVRLAPPAPLEDLRVTLSRYCEPEAADVDIAKEPVLVAVGRGLQNPDNVDLAQALAEALGGAVCGSRPVVDQGWLPLSRLVGKSGKAVKPKLYLALGISGAPEHVEGLAGAETIVAVNTDPQAPIFNVAQYGAVVSVFDLAPVLIEKIRAARAA